MSQERVTKTLESLGLTPTDAQVYVFLGKRGPQKAKDIGGPLKMPKQQLYLTLKNLQSKGIVTASLEHPAKFSALPYEKVLDLFVKSKIKEVQQIQQGKTEILSDWHSIAAKESPKESEKFTVLQGRNYVYSRLKQMIEQAEKQLLIISTVPGLIRADQFGIFDAQFKNAPDSKIQIRYLTKLSQQNARIIHDLLRKSQQSASVLEGRVANWKHQVPTRLVIRDEEEAMFFITPENDKTAHVDDICLWTNSKSLVEAFTTVFEDFWTSAIPIQEALTQIEKVQLTSKSLTASKPSEPANSDNINPDKQELFLLTSSEGLVDLSKRIMQLDEWIGRGIAVKIMAPLTHQNLRVAQLLSERCEVKNVPKVWVDDALIRGKHLFQFMKPLSSREKIELIAFFEDLCPVDVAGEEKAKRLDTMWERI